MIAAMQDSVPRDVVVIGMGYVGIPCAALLADVAGFRVTGIQRRSKRSGWKIECLNAGRNPFAGDEPGLAELLHRVVLEKNTFRVTSDYSVCGQADVILIDVQTPVDEDRVPRYESLRQVSEQAGAFLRPDTLVVIESTVAPGTTQHVVQPILEQASGLEAGTGFHLAFSYERVMPGKLLDFLVNMPRVVGGIDEESTRRAVELYRYIVKEQITPTDVLTAEMAKVVENAYRDVNIAFANEMAVACESMGVNVFEVRELINARSDRHMHLPGAGVGGHCLPKDPWLLVHGVRQHGGMRELAMVQLARSINDSMPQHLADVVEESLTEQGRPLEGARVAVLGVAYLEDSDDTRNTPAVPLIRALSEQGAEVVAHDPHVKDREWRLVWNGWEPVPLVRDLEAALRDADCAVVVTRHKEYRMLADGIDPTGGGLADMQRLMRTPVLVDGRNVFEQRPCAQMGLVHRGIGQGRDPVKCS